jgi:transglutaminase-like putative cysteine protease
MRQFITAWTFVLLVCLCSSPVGANEADSKSNITETEFVISYDVEGRHKSWLDSLFKRSSSQKSRTMKLWVNLPQPIPGKQEVTKISFQPEPSRHFKKNGNDYVEYEFDVPKKTAHFEIIIQAKISQRNLSTIIHSGSATTEADPNLDSNLIHERMIEKDHPLIQELASKINGENRLDTIREIYHFVPTYLSIDLTKVKGVGAARTAETKKGMCIDYCDLFVALCRAKNIPARVVAGFKCPFSASPKHSWTEVYVEPYGWISLDPTMLPNVPPAAIDDRFFNHEPLFLKCTNTRNDKVLHYNYFYSYPFWDKELMKDVRVSESIEFLKPKRLSYSSRRSRKMAEETQKKVDKHIKKQQKTKTVQE